MRVFACMCSGVRVICIAGTKFMHELFKEANLFVVGQRLYQIYIYIYIYSVYMHIVYISVRCSMCEQGRNCVSHENYCKIDTVYAQRQTDLMRLQWTLV